MDRKGAIQLSMSALVIIIISVFVLATGITLLFKFIDVSVDTKERLDARTEAEIENLLLAKGQKVALPLSTQKIPSGENEIFGVGVLNIHEIDDFTMDVALSRYQDSSKSEQTGADIKEKAESWLLYSKAPFTLEQNDHTKASILVNVAKDAPKGKYIYNAKVYDSEGQYGNTQKFTVIVS